MRWLAVLVLLTGIARADPHRIDPLLPQHTAGITATSTGGALVLGERSATLIEIDATGTVREVAHPDVGSLRSFADDRWILGDTGLLHRRDAAAQWTRIELPPLPDVIDPFRPGHVVVLAPDRVVVVRVYGAEQGRGKLTTGGTKVELVDATTGTATELIDLPERILSRPAPDGEGGFWLVVRQRGYPTSDSYSGYAHFSNGKWTLFRVTMPAASSYVRELKPMVVRDANLPVVLDTLEPGADGGALAREYGRLYRVAPDGPLSVVTDVKVDKLCATVHTGTHHFVVSTTNLKRIAVTSVASDGAVVASTPLALPDWYMKAHYTPPIYYCEASYRDGRLWIASGPFVFQVAATAAGVLGPSTSIVSRIAAAETREAEATRKPSIVRTVLPPLAFIGIGTVVSAPIEGASYGATFGETLAGSAAALPAALFLDYLDQNPCIKGNDSGYQILNDIHCGVRAVGYMFAITGGGALGTLGTGLVAKSIDDLPPPRDAVIGAIVGGMIASALSIGTTKLVRRWNPRAGRIARSIVSATLIGAGSTIGYQLGR